MRRFVKIFLITVAVIIALVVALPFALYIPSIQDFAKDIALREVKKSTGMDISVRYLRIKFPLRVELNGVKVVEAGFPASDPMVAVDKAGIDVKLLPLLHGEIRAGGTELSNVIYRLGTPDSAMYLTAKVDRFNAPSADMQLKNSRIEVARAMLDGADIFLAIKDTVTPEKNDTAQSTPLFIKAGDIQLRNVRFRMTMLPTIDTLSTFIPSASLSDGIVDMSTQNITARYLKVDSITAAYFTPSAQYLKQHPAKEDSITATATVSAPWTVRADSVRITASELTYGMAGAKPQSGLDFNYLQVRNVQLAVDSLFNRGTAITVPLRHLSGTERCGLSFDAAGHFAMDSTMMHARGFNIGVGNSRLLFDADMGMGDVISDPSVPLGLTADGKISLNDVTTAMPSMARMLRGMPRRDITVNADINGTAGNIDVRRILINWPALLSMEASGQIANPTDFNRMNGQVDIKGRLNNVNVLTPSLLGAAFSKQFHIPPTAINGRINYRPRLIDGKVALTTGDGRMALDGRWNSRAEGYDATLRTSNFPVGSFMPSLGVGSVTANISAKGHGYNPMSSRTAIDTHIEVDQIVYNTVTYSDILLNAHLSNGEATGNIDSKNPGADLSADFTASIKPDEYTWNLSGDIRDLDLKSLGFSKEPLGGALSLTSDGSYSPRSEAIDARLNIRDLNWVMGQQRLTAPDVAGTFNASDSLTFISLSTGDMNAAAQAYSGLRPLMKQVRELMPFIQKQIEAKSLDVRALQAHVPQMDLNVSAGQSNLFAKYLSASDISFDRVNITAHNDSLMHLSASVNNLRSGKTLINSLKFDANQHSKFLVYSAAMDNLPGTLDDFAHVNLNGYIADDKAAVMVKQMNIKNEQGYSLGFSAAFTDSIVNLRMVPYKPVIGYKQWTVNKNNSIQFNFVDKHLDANLALSNDKSFLKIFTEHDPNAAMDSTAHRHQEDVVVQLSDIHLQDWINISPFAPPLKGDVGADLRFRWNHAGITGNGYVDVDQLYYGRDRVGTFRLDLDVANDKSGALRADVALLVDSVKVITAQGALNDSTSSSPFLLDFNMIHFPLRVVNPFLPKDVAQLRGMLNGTMNITGSMAEPIFNGYLDFDSTAVSVGMTGTAYKFSEERIPVDSNIVHFNNFAISGLNDNPLRVNGTVDARHLTNIGINLGLAARSMQIVGSTRPRGANIYGKAFIDLDAKVNGNLNFLNVDASLDLLPETNVTYVMTSSQSTLQSRSTGTMVQFVQFSDTTTVAPDSIQQSGMAMNLDAKLKISEGSTINVDISPDGKNKASIKAMGELLYNLNPMNDGRLSGRVTINSGFVRYTPPLMSEKNFSFNEGSYVSFNGDMLNPTLSIKAVDDMKANVTQTGQNSRLVNFLVSLSASGSLQNMNVAFDLSTNDDITIQNELLSMSPDQRANQAMNLLLYNVYTGPGTKGNASLSGNPLFSFLEGRINTWAANNIKFVDVSFGIDQYDKTTDGSSSTTTSYSYRVSKTLFNDRIKIVVGGNYSTDADADENFSQNLINDIAFEYMLNRSGSMYVRLFRHVGFESILEGEITQTGVGFVYKHKINSLLDLFRWGRRRSKKPDSKAKPAEATDSTSVSTNSITK